MIPPLDPPEPRILTGRCEVELTIPVEVNVDSDGGVEIIHSKRMPGVLASPLLSCYWRELFEAAQAELARADQVERENG